MTEEEYEALDAMPLYFDRNGVLPATLPNGRPAPTAEVINSLASVGLIVQLHDRWAIADPSGYAKGAGSKSGP